MRAVGYFEPLSIDHPDALVDIDLPVPTPGPRDLLVEVAAVSVNPVDVKIRAGVRPSAGTPKVLGWDAAGVVREVGAETSLFKPGDRVWYAGSIARPGTDARFHAVDERIVGRMPSSLNFAAAAAVPLTAITAWELLFDRLAIPRGTAGGSLLIVGGAGGVGSMLIQIARRLTGMTVIATASRPETRAWCLELGAHHVIDHARPLVPQLAAIGVSGVEAIASLTATEAHFAELVEAAAPQGAIAVIDDPARLDVMPLKRKSLSLRWELMFTRSLFETPDMIAQHRLLNEVADLVDQGVLRTTLTENLGTIDAANLRRAHALIESGRARGKVVLEGFAPEV